MSESQNKAGIAQRIWDLFASVKLSFILFLALAAASVAGTLLPQKEHAEIYIKQFGQDWGGVILALGLHDAYHAPWFLALLALLAANLVVCSADRLPKVLKIIKKDPAQDLKRNLHPTQEFTLAGDMPLVEEKARGLLGRRMGKVHSGQADKGGIVLLAQKGAWSRLGVYLVHSSVLVILAGALVGGIWGFSGYVSIDEGKTADHIELDNGTDLPLGFGVRLDKFTLKNYEGKNIPSEYRSDVTFLKGGAEVKKASLIVNDPAEFESIVFYMSGYGSRAARVKLAMLRGEKNTEIWLNHGAWSDLPGGGRAGILAYRDSVSMGSMYTGPIARVAYQPKNGDAVSITAFKPGAKIPGRGPVKFEVLEAQVVDYAGLQVKYDPGVWLIWVGCTLMVVGFIIAFYLSHRKVWVRLTPNPKGRVKVELACSTNKNRSSLERLLLRMAAELKQEE